MARYRKRPVVIEAEQWFPGKHVEGVVMRPSYSTGGFSTRDRCPIVETLEGPMQVSAGDWIITGVKGEKYPCKPDIFEQTYELVDD